MKAPSKSINGVYTSKKGINYGYSIHQDRRVSCWKVQSEDEFAKSDGHFFVKPSVEIKVFLKTKFGEDLIF